MEPLASNIIDVYNRATAEQIEAGMHWYDVAYEEARRISKGRSIKKAAGILSATSPRREWGQNIRITEKCFKNKGLIGGTGGDCMTATANSANRIFNGEDPLVVLKGDKTRAFYQCIVNVDTAPCCVDRHAIDIALAKVHTEENRPRLGKKLYAEFAEAYDKAAAEIGIPVAKLQAITWLVWRAEKGIK
jgi:hypothetical protein